MRYKSIVLILLSIFTLASCKATPDSETVKKKTDILNASEAPRAKYKAPEKWTETFEAKAGILYLDIKAEINVPDTTAFPVYSVEPVSDFQGMIDKYIKILMDGQQIYYPKTDEDMTKSEIDLEIAKLMDSITNPESDLNDLRKRSEANYKETLKWYEEEIASLKEKRKKAADTYKPKKATGKLEPLNLEGPQSSGGFKFEGNFYQTSVETALKNGVKNRFGAYKNGSNKNINISFIRQYGEKMTGGKLLYDTENLPKISITKKQAASMAEKFLEKLKIKNMTLAGAGSIPYYDWRLEPEEGTYYDLPKCITLFYTRNIDGIGSNFINSNSIYGNVVGGDKFSETWNDEFIQICVDDTGVIEFDYHSPVSVKKKELNNVALLPFEEIKERFKKQIEMSATYDKDPSIISRKVSIDKITLGYARIPSKDNPDEGLLVPVWDFYGISADKYSPEVTDPNFNENNENIVDDCYQSFLSINAIDGSVVERISSANK